MRTKMPLVIAALCGWLASSASAEHAAKNSSTPAPSPAVKAAVQDEKTQPAPIPKAGSTVPPSSELAASLEVEEANKEHIKESRTFLTVDTPPPAPREEKKPPAPAAGLVWVAGHWLPVKGDWQWKSGEWGFPATPVSVWIESKYDPKTKRWTAGYWQPDKPSPEPVSSDKEPATPATQKFF
jgi:hypothetical protein